MRRFIGVLGLCLLAAGARGGDAQLEAVKELLAKPLIGPETTMAETQAFIEARLPQMPEPASAEAWQPYAEQMRKGVLDRIVFRGEAAAWRDAACKVEWLETIPGGEGYHIRKLRYEAIPGMWIPALLYEPEKLEGRVPVILNVNGHDAVGKAAPYKQARCINQAKRGMLALNIEWFGMGQLRTDGFNHGRLNQIDLCGTSGLAPFYLAMSRGLDILLAHPNADPARTAVMGLSGGGWQTIFFSALDPRVVFANPVAGYSGFATRVRNIRDLGDSEQTPNDLATLVDYTHLTAMRAPRPTLLTFNAKDDCCFRADQALDPLLKAAQPIYALLGKPENLRSHVNEDPGTHNFEKDNRQAMYRALGDYFYAGDATFSAEEIPCEGEIKTAEDLNVALPEGNLDFHTIAQRLAAGFEYKMDKVRRVKLGEAIKVHEWGTIPTSHGTAEKAGIRAEYWTLQIGGAWTVPVVELSMGTGGAGALTCGEKGRAEAAEKALELLEEGRTVFVMDPFYFGECAIQERAYLFALLIDAVGERTLGIQVGQVLSVGWWIQESRGLGPVNLTSVNRRMRLILSLASDGAALRRTGGLETGVGEMKNGWVAIALRKAIEENLTFEERPEVFCFGLLKALTEAH